jgi:predicted metal-dependent hydrolase
MTAQAKIKASFPVRRMDFGFKDVPKYWFANDPFLTHFLTSLSSLFPEGEFFFVTSPCATFVTKLMIRSCRRKFLPLSAKRPCTPRSIKPSMTMPQRTGLMWTTCTAVLANCSSLAHKDLTHKQQLAVTCALEHFTATIANQLMKREDINGLMIDPMMRKMWLWHAVEESEHKSVCYDAYQRLYKNSYGTRASFMMLAWSILALVLVEQQVRLMAKDKQLLNFPSWRRGMWTLFGYKGFLSELAVPLLDYFRPGFHPEDHFSDDMEAKYKAPEVR